MEDLRWEDGGMRETRTMGTLGSTEPVPLNPEFERLADEAFLELTAMEPVRASWLGLHGHNDGQLPTRSPDSMSAAWNVRRRIIRDFEAFDARRLRLCQAVDRELTIRALEAELALEDRRPAWRSMPQLYLRDVIDGLYVILLREYGSLEQRGEDLVSRLRQTPGLLAAARENLLNPPALFTEQAALLAQMTADFLDDEVIPFVARLPRTLRSAGDTAAAEARLAVMGYHDYLAGSLMAASRGEFCIGKNAFNRLLRDRQMIPYDADDLVVLGGKIYHESLRTIRAAAGRIRSGRSWSILLNELKDDHPEPEKVLDAYTRTIAAARAFVVERRLAALPEEDGLRVVPTPAFGRALFPRTRYLHPAPFENSCTGTVWVTVPRPADSPEKIHFLLRGHGRAVIPVLAVHEGYPGHHLHTLAYGRQPRRLRALFPSDVLFEGWALHCEELMREHGFLADPRVCVMQLHGVLWRACRVLVDVGLHTGIMTFSEAVTFLVRKGRMDRPAALAEVRRCCESPTQPASWGAGKSLLERLMDDCRDLSPSGVEDRVIRETVMSCGNLPVELARKQLGLKRSGEDVAAPRPVGRPARRAGGA